MKERLISQNQMTDDIEMTAKTLNMYLNDDFIDPPLSDVVKIAKYLNLSSDFLLGIFDRPEPITKEAEF